jgi:hypothetical protein
MRVSTPGELMMEPLSSNDHAQARRKPIGDHATRKGIVGSDESRSRAPLNERRASTPAWAAASAWSLSGRRPRL